MDIQEAKAKFNEDRDVDAADVILKAAIEWAEENAAAPVAQEIVEPFQAVIDGINITRKRKAAERALPLLEKVNVC